MHKMTIADQSTYKNQKISLNKTNLKQSTLTIIQYKHTTRKKNLRKKSSQSIIYKVHLVD